MRLTPNKARKSASVVWCFIVVSSACDMSEKDASSIEPQRRRTAFVKDQRRILEEFFTKNPYPQARERKELADLLDVKESSILWWFGHRRARDVRARRMRAVTVDVVAERERDYTSSAVGEAAPSALPRLQGRPQFASSPPVYASSFSVSHR